MAGVDKSANDLIRLRRMFQRLASGTAWRFGPGISFDPANQRMQIDLATASGLNFDPTSGDSGKLTIDLDTNPGLQLAAGGLSMLLDSNSGLQLGAGGVSIDLADSPSILTLAAGGLGTQGVSVAESGGNYTTKLEAIQNGSADTLQITNSVTGAVIELADSGDAITMKGSASATLIPELNAAALLIPLNTGISGGGADTLTIQTTNAATDFFAVSNAGQVDIESHDGQNLNLLSKTHGDISIQTTVSQLAGETVDIDILSGVGFFGGSPGDITIQAGQSIFSTSVGNAYLIGGISPGTASPGGEAVVRGGAGGSGADGGLAAIRGGQPSTGGSAQYSPAKMQVVTDGGTVTDVVHADLNASNAATLGFYGTTPVVQSAAYTPSNVTTDRTYDANATSTAELADVLGTLIADLQALGLIG